MKKLFLCVIVVIYSVCIFAQDVVVYPTHWWVGMKNPKLQLVLRGNGIGNASGFTINYPGVVLNKVTKPSNKNYAYLDVTIAPSAKPGTFVIKATGLSSNTPINYTLNARRAGRVLLLHKV